MAFVGPAVDRGIVGQKKILVVGCGSEPQTHRNEPHRFMRRDGRVTSISLDKAYTMDVDGSMRPDRIGSFWVEDHVEDLPSNHFLLIFFENLPRDLFETPGWASIAARNSFRLLTAHGMVLIRTGADKTKEGKIDPALRNAGFQSVETHRDEWGMPLHICGAKA